MNLFNLPNSILIKIYEYDNTYQEILRKILKADLNKTIMDKHMKSLDIYENHILKTLLHKIKLNPSNVLPFKDEIRFYYASNCRVIAVIKNVEFEMMICCKEAARYYINKQGMNKEDFVKVGKKENLRYITI